MKVSEQINSILQKLIDDGNRLVNTGHNNKAGGREISDREGLRRWSNELVLFKSIAGNIIRPWERRLRHNGVVIMARELEYPISALETIKDAIDQGLLNSFEDLVYAQAFSDLYEQGEYLLSQGYFLASGVIFRAVLEERLRRLCEQNTCMPQATRPTINDLNIALYKHDPPIYDKSMMLNVTALASVGNDAAHNNPNLKSEDVQRLKNGLLDFLAKFSG